MTATTFDPNNKTASVALSGGNLVATSSAASNVAVTRPLTGPHYAEATITTLTGTPAIGLVSATNAMGATLLGGDANGVGYRSGGTVVANGATLATLAAFVQGDRIGVAVDPANRLIWFRVNNGNWNNNVANNPATGVGGIDYSSVTFARTYLACSFSLTGAVWTGKFSTAFTDTAPSGFASIDNVQTTAGQATSKDAGPLAVTPDFSAVVGRATTTQRGVRMFSPAGAITTVSGTTKESGVAVASKKVYMYDRNTGELLGCTTSDGSGVWSISALGRPAALIVGSDPPYNSVVYDNVVPV